MDCRPVDQAMVDCILAAVPIGHRCARNGHRTFHDIDGHGLVLLPSGDPFLAVDGARAAGRPAPQPARLDGLGHWWMLEDPAKGALRVAEILGLTHVVGRPPKLPW